MRRFSTMPLALLLALGTNGCTREDSPPSAAPGPPPSLVLLLVDTLRADHLGCYGYDRPTSPHLDELARDSLRVEHCVAQSSWTKPTTASILSGRLPSEHGAQHAHSALSPSVELLPEILQRHGYRTAAFVANGFIFDPKAGFRQGFDHFVAYADPANSGDPGVRQYERADRLIDDALAWIDGIPEGPYFVYVHVVDPHAPYDPPSPFRERFDRGYQGDVTGFTGMEQNFAGFKDFRPEDWQHLIDLYDAEIASTDAQLGRLVEGLRRRPEQPGLIFTADHGEEFFEHGSWHHPPHLYQEVLHVPLVLNFPWRNQSGLIGGLRQQIDVVPTILAALGIAPEVELPGQNLLAAPPEQTVICEVDQSRTLRKAALAGGMKYIRQWSPSPEEWLFDLREDQGERRDLKTERVHLLRDMRARMEAHVANHDQGYRLVVYNPSRGKKCVVQGVVAVDQDVPLEVALEFGENRDALLPARMTPRGDDTLQTVPFYFESRRGDFDGLRIAPAPTARRMIVSLQVDGVDIPAASYFLGPRGEQPGTVPVEIFLPEGDGLLADMLYEPREGSAVSVRLWKQSSAIAERIEPDEAVLKHLRALGYSVEAPGPGERDARDKPPR